jgi:hypothetical protein
MMLSKEDVLKIFCIDTGIRVGQQKYQTLQNIPNVREIVPTNVFLLRRNFYLYARLQNFLKAEYQYLHCKIATIRENCANIYAKAREP